MTPFLQLALALAIIILAAKMHGSCSLFQSSKLMVWAGIVGIALKSKKIIFIKE